MEQPTAFEQDQDVDDQDDVEIEDQEAIDDQEDEELDYDDDEDGKLPSSFLWISFLLAVDEEAWADTYLAQHEGC